MPSESQTIAWIEAIKRVRVEPERSRQAAARARLVITADCSEADGERSVSAADTTLRSYLPRVLTPLAFAASALVALMFWPSKSTSMAIADVVAAVAETKLLFCDVLVFEDGKRISRKTILSRDGSARIESSDGTLIVVDRNKDAATLIDSEKESFIRMQGIPVPSLNPYEFLKTLHASGDAQLVGKDQLDDSSVSRFRAVDVEVDQWMRSFDIWVDEQTMLPVKIVVTWSDGGKESREVISDMRFEVKQADPSLFIADIPDDYQLIGQMDNQN